jgi:hypothetical protein
MTPLMRSTLLVQQAEDDPCAQLLVQTGPEGACEARVAVQDEQVGQPYITKHRHNEVARRRLGGSGLESRD